MLDLILSFVWAFMIAVFAIPSIIYVSHLKNLLDEPSFRTVHVSLTPRLGGLAIFAGFMSALTIFGDVNFGIQRILAGCIVLFFIGLKDDIVSISAFKKFFVQILATGIVMFMGDIRLTSFQGFMDIYELDPGISYGLTFLIIVGVTNAINLIDGLDGLAGTIIMIIVSAFGMYFFFHGGEAFQAYAVLAFCLAGGILGFLRYNMHKAIIFMGDTGSLVCGFLVAVLAIQFVEMNTVATSPAIAVAILAIPLFDTIRVFSIRILKGKSPFSPDKNHIHHILLGAGLSQLQTVFVLAAINFAIIGVVVCFSDLGNNMLLLGLITTGLVAAIVLQLMSTKKNKQLVKQ
jgi:UDP-GlcNAc:undecaprenyl-phosphate GlcNAc-1-phosphate transferase